MRFKTTLFLLGIFLPALAHADFENDVWGARPLALGGASIGIPGDAYTLFSNPAGLAHLKSDETAFSFGRSSPRPDDKPRAYGYLAYVDTSDSRLGTFGFWWAHATLSEIRRENTLAMSLSRSLQRVENGPHFSWGANFKYLSNVALSGPRRDQSALSADLGMLYAPFSRVALGAVLRDINRPHVSVTDSKKLPMTFGVGSSLRLTQSTLLALDMVKSQNDDRMRMRGGVETWFSRSFGLQFGLNSQHMVYGFRLKRGDASGFQLGFEYAYADPFDLNKHDRVHYASLRVGFGKRNPEKVWEKMTKSDFRARKQTDRLLINETPALLRASALEEKNAVTFGPGDVLEIHVQNHPELDVSSVTVDSWGFIKLPYIGDLEVSGFTKEKVESAMSKIYAEFFKEPPLVDVTIREFNSRMIYVLGEVRSPGRYPLERALNLRDAVLQAGLPTERAATWRTFIIRQGRAGPTYKHINLHRVLYRADLYNNITLEPGDVVYIPMGYLDSIFAFVGRILSPIFGITNNLVRPIVP